MENRELKQCSKQAGDLLLTKLKYRGLGNA